MVETGQDTLTPALESLKSQAEALKTKVEEQRALLAAEKAKGRKAEKANVDAIKAALDALLPEAEKVFVTYTKLQRKAAGSPTGPSILAEVTTVVQDSSNDMLHEQIENLMAEAGVVEAGIPGVTTEAEATTFVEALREKENPTEADQVLIFLYDRVQALEQRLAAAPTAPTAPDATTPGVTGGATGTAPEATTAGAPEATEPVTATTEEEDESDYFDSLAAIGKNAWERVKKFLPKRASLEEKQKKKAERAVKEALEGDYDVLTGILENPERPTKRKLLDKRESVLLPILAVLEENNVLRLKQQSKDVLIGYPDEVIALKGALNSTDYGDPALPSFLTWARLNLHKFNALPEVETAAAAPTPPVSPDTTATVNGAGDGNTSEAGGTPNVVTTPVEQVTGVTDVNLPGDGGTSPNEELDGSGKAVAPTPESTQTKETDAKKALKAIYARARARVPATADESTKLNAVATRESGRSRQLSEAVRNFTNVLDGKETKVDENSAELQAQMVILLVMSEVESAFNKLNPKSPTSLAELKALVAKISS